VWQMTWSRCIYAFIFKAIDKTVYCRYTSSVYRNNIIITYYSSYYITLDALRTRSSENSARLLFSDEIWSDPFAPSHTHTHTHTYNITDAQWRVHVRTHYRETAHINYTVSTYDGVNDYWNAKVFRPTYADQILLLLLSYRLM